jgi:hypothetical protein
MTGNWAPLLTISPVARRILHEADDDRLARDVLALVHAGQLSRGMARADALALASPTASTIEALRALHPPDDHSLSPHAPLFCPDDLERLAPPLAPGADPHEPLSHASFHEVLFRRLPRCSAADHGGWRYEYLSSTYRYTSLLFVLMLLLARLHLPPLSLAVELMPSGAFAPPCSPVAYLPVFGPGSLVDAS